MRSMYMYSLLLGNLRYDRDRFTSRLIRLRRCAFRALLRILFAKQKIRFRCGWSVWLLKSLWLRSGSKIFLKLYYFLIWFLSFVWKKTVVSLLSLLFYLLRRFFYFAEFLLSRARWYRWSKIVETDGCFESKRWALCKELIWGDFRLIFFFFDSLERKIKRKLYKKNNWEFFRRS